MRCKGTTRAGVRCKRQAGEGAEFCASHAGQAGDGPPRESKARDQGGRRPEPDITTEGNKDDRAGRHDSAPASTRADWFDLAFDGIVVIAALAAVVLFGRWRR